MPLPVGTSTRFYHRSLLRKLSWKAAGDNHPFLLTRITSLESRVLIMAILSQCGPVKFMAVGVSTSTIISGPTTTTLNQLKTMVTSCTVIAVTTICWVIPTTSPLPGSFVKTVMPLIQAMPTHWSDWFKPITWTNLIQLLSPDEQSPTRILTPQHRILTLMPTETPTTTPFIVVIPFPALLISSQHPSTPWRT